MDTVVYLVACVAFLLTFLVLGKRRKLPPGRFSIPFIGTPGLLLTLPGKRPYEVFLDETKYFGNIFSFGIIHKKCVVLNGYDAIHEAFVENAAACSGRMEELRKIMNVEGKEEGMSWNLNFTLLDFENKDLPFL